MSGINQKLEQKLLQKLSPQQIQLIKLLEVPIIELEQRIKKEIEENPALEEVEEEVEEQYEPDFEEDFKEEPEKNTETTEDSEEPETPTEPEQEEQFPETESDDDFDYNEYAEDDEIPDYKLVDRNYAEDDSNYTQNSFSEISSLTEYLEEQLGLLNLDEIQLYVATYIIGNIEEDGYFRRDLNAIPSELLLFHNVEVTLDEVKYVFTRIQKELEPAGIAARNLQECLLLQLKRKINENQENETILNLTYTIIDEYFDLFSKKHFDKITSKLNISDDLLREVIDIILKLNPKPGNNYASAAKRNFHQVIPDFVVQIIDSELVISLNNLNIPALHINKEFEIMLKTFSNSDEKTQKEKDTFAFVKQKVDSAKWFIDAIQQRQNTLLRTMESILEYQRLFFLTGDETKLKPMILKDIAQKTSLDISTISRVANSKYVQTPWGIYPLKFFFSEGMENEEGDEVSTRQIKQILKEAIESEEKSKPLTDEKLSQILREKGYNIARRTVAKYREQLGILVARLRKQI